VIIRDYKTSDFEAIREIHDATDINYKFPDINKPVWLVKKVVENEGKVVAACGLYIQVECYLWMRPTDWADPETKLAVIEIMDRQAMQEAWLKGVDQAVLWLPPGMERFGERLVEDLHFTKDRSGWISFSKDTKQ
jgi:hypothetical protein